MDHKETVIKRIENARVFDDGTFSKWINDGLEEAIRVIRNLPSDASKKSMIDAVKARKIDCFPERYDVYNIWRNNGLDRAIGCIWKA